MKAECSCVKQNMSASPLDLVPKMEKPTYLDPSAVLLRYNPAVA